MDLNYAIPGVTVAIPHRSRPKLILESEADHAMGDYEDFYCAPWFATVEEAQDWFSARPSFHQSFAVQAAIEQLIEDAQ